VKFVTIDRIHESMVLARPVYTSDGRILLNSGVKLQNNYARKLAAIGVPGVYVTREGIEDVDIPEAISQSTRQAAVVSIRSVFEEIRIGRTFSMDSVHASVNSILEDIAHNPNVLVNLTDVRTYDGYTFAHSVNVCVLAVLLGSKCGLHELDLRQLALGAILHDVGKIAVPESILKKPGPLTDEEMEEMKNHSLYGWQVLRQHPELSLTSAHIAYQHHEKPNGQGYPRGLKKDEISLYSKICGIADAYDAMTSQRVYRSGMMPYQALSQIQELRDIQFDSALVDDFIQCVAPYPVGCLVRLNDGRVGMVVGLNSHDRQQPVVRILYGKEGRALDRPFEMDLADEPLYTIKEVMDDA